MKDCIKKLEISRSTNPWQGLTSSYKEEEENKHIKAVSIDAKKSIPMENLKQYSFNNEYFLVIAEKPKKVLVNNKFFSNLERKDATRISMDEKQLIGRFLDTSFISITPDKLVLFLLESQIIITYWHLESEICLANEKNEAEEYSAFFTGMHKYCTNSCSQDTLKFSVKINKNTGEMYLCGW